MGYRLALADPLRKSLSRMVAVEWGDDVSCHGAEWVETWGLFGCGPHGEEAQGLVTVLVGAHASRASGTMDGVAGVDAHPPEARRQALPRPQLPGGRMAGEHGSPGPPGLWGLLLPVRFCSAPPTPALLTTVSENLLEATP